VQAEYEEGAAIAVAADWTANDYEGNAATAAAAAAAAEARPLILSSAASFFETTIRYVGGLLSAYATPLSHSALLLHSVQVLPDRKHSSLF
jgi:hypothetical protein